MTTNSARQQELSLNPQKLAGQCGKLKCCLNYELDAYIDAQKDFPNVRQPLETMDGLAYHQKTDIFKRVMWYSYDPHSSVNITVVPIDRVKEIIAMNKEGKKPDTLLINDKNNPSDSSYAPEETSNDYKNAVGDDAINRFDKKKKKKKKKPQNQGNQPNAPKQPNPNQQQPKQPNPNQQPRPQNQPNQPKPKNKNNNNNGKPQPKPNAEQPKPNAEKPNTDKPNVE